MHLSNMEMVGRPSHEIPPAQKIKMEMIRIRITIRLRFIIMTIMMMVLTKVIMMMILTQQIWWDGLVMGSYPLRRPG